MRVRPVAVLADGHSAEDLATMIAEGKREGVIEEFAHRLLTGAIVFGDRTASQVMVPRPDMVTVPGDASTDEALDIILEQGRSRIPVTGEGIDDIVGILYARDLLVLYDQAAPPSLSIDLARPPYFVPESKQVSELLKEMQASQVHMAIVVDEFGGTAGLVTIEDLLEELVGEIADEYDTEEPMAVEVEEGVLLVDARMDVDEFAGLVEIELPDDEYDTVGGLVLGLAGRVPREGESFEYDGLTLTVARVQGRRVSRVRVRRH
ncbi:MAG: HlyC/CorC family transporter, partial [Actinobacteria bacterium]